MEAVLLDFQQKIGQEDIIIHFYEKFLDAYKPQMREERGVYYTPESVVSYIVRSVDHILAERCGHDEHRCRPAGRVGSLFTTRARGDGKTEIFAGT